MQSKAVQETGVTNWIDIPPYRSTIANITKAIALLLSGMTMMSMQNSLFAIECDSRKAIQFYDRVFSPEDMVAVPNTDFLIVSHAKQNGAISLFNTKTGDLTQIHSANSILMTGDVQTGERRCQPPQTFTPQGIDLIDRADGRFALFAVNHRDRDFIEIFELRDVETAPVLHWQGCVAMPDNILLNDVAALTDGGFMVTANPRVNPELDDFDNPWRVLRWHQIDGLSIFLSFDHGMGNGISASSDGKYVFVNDMKRGLVLKVSINARQVEAVAEIDHPDNNSWTDSSQILVSSVPWSSWEEIASCLKITHGHCNLAFKIHLLDPSSMKSRVVYGHDGKVGFGGATVAVDKGGHLYLGSFAGNRMVRVSCAGTGNVP